MNGRTLGWCPTLFDPMTSGDGLLARVKPPLGRISAAAARELATAARRWGNGQLELTNRGALQARGFSETSLPKFREVVLAEGLASAEPSVERRRNVVLSPFAEAAGEALARELERWIAEDEALAALPAKFGFAVAADNDPHPLPADICLTSLAREEPLASAQAIVRRFLELAAELDPPPRRMADLVQRASVPSVSFADSSPTTQGSISAQILHRAAREVDRRVSAGTEGALLIAGRIGEAFALGLPFGAMTADHLDLAAEYADRFAEGMLRLSPWRALVLAGVPKAAITELAAAAGAAGFIVDPIDPRLSVVACVGAPGCASAHAATRLDAGRVASSGVKGLVHLSGCAKGCAHPAAAPVTLVATQHGYDLVRDGRAGDAPARRGLTLDAALDLLAAEPAEIP